MAMRHLTGAGGSARLPYGISFLSLSDSMSEEQTSKKAVKRKFDF
jgi:hypothetical protein